MLYSASSYKTTWHAEGCVECSSCTSGRDSVSFIKLKIPKTKRTFLKTFINLWFSAWSRTYCSVNCRLVPSSPCTRYINCSQITLKHVLLYTHKRDKQIAQAWLQAHYSRVGFHLSGPITYSIAT